jgi:hypothetical protein
MWFRFGLVLIFAVGSAFAQATATIQGTVYDASGALVPGASVTAANVETGLTRSVVSDESGQYVIPLLPVGAYRVEIRKEGFATFEQRDLRLEVNTTVQVNGRLEVRTATEQVTVNAIQTLVQTASTNLVQVVDQRRIADLPLNGRNVLQLMTLNSGVSDQGAAGGTIQTNSFGGATHHVPTSMNGSRGNGTNFLLDNTDNNDLYSNISNPYPNPDAVQEFSIQTSTFDAQYGRGVGGVVNVVTRSGTNELHGTVFEFLRNSKMNAANFFSGRDALKRNQYGFTLGGPVRLGSLYDGRNRTFFFGSYQGTRVRVSTPGALAIAPSDAMKAGDFSAFLRAGGVGAIKDPLSPGSYFPNNRIPPSRFDPVSVKLLEHMPSSSTSNYQLRYGTPTRPTDDDQFMFRGDHMLTSNQRASVRYFRMEYDRPWSFIPKNLYYVSAGQFGHSHNLTVNHTWTISPRLLNEFNFNFNGSTPESAPPQELGVTLDKLGARVKTVPGVPALDLSISNWTGISLGLGYYNGQRMYQASETIGYATGRHNIRVGFDYKNHLLDKSSYWLSGGSPSFSGQLSSDPGKSNAGNAFAEFLMGQLAGWRQQSAWAENLYTTYVAAFFQDDFRVTTRLTLNLGLRWDPKLDSRESLLDKRTTFVPGQQSQRFVNAPRGLLFLGDPGYENYIVSPDWNNFAPRVGLAYELASRSVLRAAYGVFYDQVPGIFNNRSAQAEPFIVQSILTATGTLSDPYSGGPVLEPVLPNPGRDFVFRPYSTWAVPARDMVAGYMHNWNVVLERQFWGELLGRIAYVGSKGQRLLHSPEMNPGLYGPGATPGNVNQRRQYQPIGGLQLGRSDAWSKYHSLQVTVQKRYSRSFTITGHYTWAKSTDLTSYGSVEGNTTGPNPFNYRDNVGSSDFDLAHRFVASGIWDLPALKDWNAIARGILGSWQANFIFSANTGRPITIFSGVDNALMGVGGNFADLTGVDWRLPSGRSRDEQVQQWFNPAAFRVNAVGTIGTGRRNQLRVPGAWNTDASLFKNFPIGERFKLQYRAEFFNFFNHTRLGAPNTTATSTNFSRISSAADPRIVQMGLKAVF